MPEALYDRIGIGYSRFRQPDPRIAAQLSAALGSARTVLNVGAGTGSYEPADRTIIAVEPSAAMVRQRPRSPAVVLRAVAEHLPLRTASVDAAMAILTVHHWPDWRAGLLEMRRVARESVVLLTHDPSHDGFWLTQEYFPEILATERKTLPALSEITGRLGSVDVRVVPVPHDCTDGFLGAYWRRPERYLDAEVRRAISAFSKLPSVEAGLARLSEDLESGKWNARYEHLLSRTELDLGYRIVVSRLARA